MEKRFPGELVTFTTRSFANESVDREKRYKQIIDILKDNSKPMTAKEISVEMYKRGFTPTSERNFSSPRITELLRNGTLDVVGKKRCKFTGKTVTVYKLREFKIKEGQTTIFDFIEDDEDWIFIILNLLIMER